MQLLVEVHVLLPLIACLLNALSALAIWLMDPRQTANRIATALIGLAAWWGFCQVLWASASDAQTAYTWHHLAGPGWAFIGPLALHLLTQHASRPSWTMRALPIAYAVSCGFAVMQLSTSWLHRSAIPTTWGWGFEPGPGHTWFLAFTFACVIPAVTIAVTRVKHAASPAERRQLRLIGIGITTPFLLAGLSGGFLPLFDVQVPRLGSISFAVLGVIVAYSHYRYGFSALAPSGFSKEIIETLPSGLALVDLEGSILTANDRMSELLGVERDELVGVPVERALNLPIVTPPRDLREFECTLTPPGTEQSFPVAISTSLLRDKLDLPIGIVLVVHDRREVVELRGHLVTSGRLAAVGELAAGIAHEINNPIAFIRANLSQLQRNWEELSKRLPARSPGEEPDVDLVEEGEELIAECIEGVERTVRIVQDVRGLAHAGSRETESVDPNELLDRSLRVIEPQLHYGIRIERDLQSVPPVHGSAAQLQQVFLNLLLNARQAIEEEGVIRVSTRADETTVSILIEDDGCGIAQEDCDRIFDPFFTTKPAGVGTGIGLAISFQIIENHEGKILVESKPGEGTTFTVRLPIGPPN
jgi:signal transduction histidine kinase